MYERPITRTSRTAFIIALDLSGSMSESTHTVNGTTTKADAVSRIVNGLLFDLIEKARRNYRVHDYYDIAVIGYSGRGIESLLSDDWFLTVEQLDKMPYILREYREELIYPNGVPTIRQVKYPCWINPQAEGQTPLYGAFLQIYELAERWCSDPRNRNGFPPTIFNITDGEASDADAPEIRDICRRIRLLGTTDGEVLLLNIHLSTDTRIPALLFPTEQEYRGMGPYARLLFDCSSTIPKPLEEYIRQMKRTDEPGPFRGMSYNCSLHETVSILNIGSNSRPIQ